MALKMAFSKSLKSGKGQDKSGPSVRMTGTSPKMECAWNTSFLLSIFIYIGIFFMIIIYPLMNCLRDHLYMKLFFSSTRSFCLFLSAMAPFQFAGLGSIRSYLGGNVRLCDFWVCTKSKCYPPEICHNTFVVSVDINLFPFCHWALGPVAITCLESLSFFDSVF